MTFEVDVSIPYFNNLPRDCATNVWHFDRIGVSDPTDLELLGLISDVKQFYQTAYTAAGTAAAYANPDDTRYKVYDLTDTPPRAPRLDFVEALVMSQEAVTTLPPEVSVVCSYRGAGVSGIPLASQRGRVYLGVLGDSVVSEGEPAAFPTVGEGFRTAVNGAANSLVSDVIVSGFTWVVLSRKLSTTFPVVAGHVDDAFDIQRRRGQDPSIRNTWP